MKIKSIGRRKKRVPPFRLHFYECCVWIEDATGKGVVVLPPYSLEFADDIIRALNSYCGYYKKGGAK